MSASLAGISTSIDHLASPCSNLDALRSNSSGRDMSMIVSMPEDSIRCPEIDALGMKRWEPGLRQIARTRRGGFAPTRDPRESRPGIPRQVRSRRGRRGLEQKITTERLRRMPIFHSRRERAQKKKICQPVGLVSFSRAALITSHLAFSKNLGCNARGALFRPPASSTREHCDGNGA